jgi:hypothetical protein
MLLELQFSIDRTDAGQQDEEQGGPDNGKGDRDDRDHEYCFPWLVVFSRKGVERAG